MMSLYLLLIQALNAPLFEEEIAPMRPIPVPVPDIDREWLRESLAAIVVQNRGTPRLRESQRLFDRLAEACLDEQDLELGMASALLHSLRVAGRQADAFHVLAELISYLCVAGVMDAREPMS